MQKEGQSEEEASLEEPRIVAACTRRGGLTEARCGAKTIFFEVSPDPALGARPMATRSIVVCSGVLPIAHRIHVIGSVIIHIAGCAISPFTSTLELVLTVDREAVGYNVKHGIRMQRHHG